MQFRMTASVEAEVTQMADCWLMWNPATREAQSPTLDSHVRRIASWMGDDDLTAELTILQVNAG